MVSGEGYTVDPAEIAPVKALKEKTPTAVSDLRQMLGFLSYYQCYIPHFSSVARPLYELLTSPCNETIKENLRKPKATLRTKKGHLPSCTTIQWSSIHQDILADRSSHKTSNPGLP